MGNVLRVINISLIIVIGNVMLAGCGNSSDKFSDNNVVQRLDLSSYSPEKPQEHLNLLFIHHSCGATLLADRGDKAGEYCLYDTHPDGGGLRNLLKQNNYNVHEATYGSKLGQDTDINHWYAKFRDQMDLALKTKLQDELLDDDEVNQVIVFKSCYPNNHFISDGKPPGDPNSPERTVWNAKAAYSSLLPIFEKHPDTLFVVITAPPIVKPWISKYKEMFLRLINKGPERIGERSRTFNNWLVDSKNGWLADYKLQNVLVFDLYNILTEKGASNWAQYPTQNGKDSHPNNQGNKIASEYFTRFINSAVRYAGLVTEKQGRVND